MTGPVIPQTGENSVNPPPAITHQPTNSAPSNTPTNSIQPSIQTTSAPSQNTTNNENTSNNSTTGNSTTLNPDEDRINRNKKESRKKHIVKKLQLPHHHANRIHHGMKINVKSKKFLKYRDLFENCRIVCQPIFSPGPVIFPGHPPYQIQPIPPPQSGETGIPQPPPPGALNQEEQLPNGNEEGDDDGNEEAYKPGEDTPIVVTFSPHDLPPQSDPNLQEIPDDGETILIDDKKKRLWNRKHQQTRQDQKKKI